MRGELSLTVVKARKLNRFTPAPFQMLVRWNQSHESERSISAYVTQHKSAESEGYRDWEVHTALNSERIDKSGPA